MIISRNVPYMTLKIFVVNRKSKSKIDITLYNWSRIEVNEVSVLHCDKPEDRGKVSPSYCTTNQRIEVGYVYYTMTNQNRGKWGMYIPP
jgi:hypothetical protein